MTVTVVGSFTPSVLLDLAASTGHLREHGLDVEEVPVSSSPGQFRSLLDDELHVALTSPDNVMAYRFSPANPLGALADVRIVGAVDRGMGLGLYARPGLGRDDLAGARVGVDVPTSGFAFALYALADALGTSRDDYELLTLGSTPRRLEALLAGDCDVTMLNAGNELVAEAAGCVRLAGVERLGAYLGTVVAVAGERHLPEAEALVAALLATGRDVLEGRLDAEAAAAAAARLDLTPDLAARYVARMRSATEGLVPDGAVDRPALETLVRLRTTYQPVPAPGGGDVLDAALDEDSGLVHPR
ncbi:PhnD/SsuA/transferrin family substrate-binding protein [Nocardioides sp. 31GB23]|uniref:ABC transporter substrate-binding protein n=1 Tax=Nocardioides sp. 31GB23 TaxID=3156065 RepID=UPI0032AF6CD5